MHRYDLIVGTAIVALYMLAGRVSAQTLNNIPPCYQDCIKNSGDFTCNGIDVACICRLSNGNFLTDVITCIKSSCDDTLDTNDLLQPLVLGCNLAGVPIASGAIANAQNLVSATTIPITVTGARTLTSTFASAGTTFIVAVPISISSGKFGCATSTGSVSTTTARAGRTSGSNGAAAGDGSGGSSSGTTSRSGVSTTGSASLTSGSSTSGSSSTDDSSASGTAATTSPSPSLSSATTMSTTSSATNAGSSAKAAANGNGSPFSNDAVGTRHGKIDLIGILVGLLAGAMIL